MFADEPFRFRICFFFIPWNQFQFKPSKKKRNHTHIFAEEGLVFERIKKNALSREKKNSLKCKIAVVHMIKSSSNWVFERFNYIVERAFCNLWFCKYAPFLLSANPIAYIQQWNEKKTGWVSLLLFALHIKFNGTLHCSVLLCIACIALIPSNNLFCIHYFIV